MYNVETIKAEFLNLVGWRQNPDPAGRQIDSELITSESGAYFQEAHPLITHDNLVSIAPMFDRRVYHPYSASTVYKEGAIITDQSKLYIAIQDTTGNPPTDTDNWKLFNPYSDWVKQLTEEGILMAISDWVETKIGMGSAKSLLSFDKLYKTTAPNTELVENDNKFVFHELTMDRSNMIKAKVNRIALTFNRASEETQVMLFHSEQSLPIRVMNITGGAAKSKKWFDLKDTTTETGKELDFVIDGSGTYYIGYSQTLLVEGAISGVNDHWADTTNIQNCQNVLGLKIRTGSIANSPGTMWDIDDNVYEPRENFGMDLSISAYCDYTDFLIQNKHMFRNLVSRAVAIAALRKMSMNPSVRDNRNQKNVDQQYARFVLHGDSENPRPQGLLHEYSKALKAMIVDQQSIDPVCLPCKSTGVTFKSIP